MSKDKAREFWLKEYPSARTVEGVKLFDAFDAKTYTGKIHVIEYSAYAELEQKLAVAVECLTYIGNGQTRMYLAQEFARACLAKLKGGKDET